MELLLAQAACNSITDMHACMRATCQVANTHKPTCPGAAAEAGKELRLDPRPPREAPLTRPSPWPVTWPATSLSRSFLDPRTVRRQELHTTADCRRAWLRAPAPLDLEHGRARESIAFQKYLQGPDCFFKFVCRPTPNGQKIRALTRGAQLS